MANTTTAAAAATKATASKPAAGVPFYTPAQNPPSGTALELDPKHPERIPTLFHPLTIRGMTLANRFVVSPMCQYSADDGHVTDWHLVQLGSYATRGAALTIVEAASVQPNGRISPEDVGIWQDSHIAPLKRIADFVHSQGHKVGIQLAHAGRKASTLAPWHRNPGGNCIAHQDVGGWPDDVWGASTIPFHSETFPQVKEMSVEQIKETVEAFGAAAQRAVAAGLDMIELHAAHGYLISSFLSPLSNQRTDAYGGSFENRIRLLVEVIHKIRSVIPSTMPLFVRISVTEWMEWTGKETWDLKQSIKLAHLLPELGVDLLDTSSGGNNPQQRMEVTRDYQLNLTISIRESLQKTGTQLLLGAVGMITTAEQARDIVQETALPDSKEANGTNAPGQSQADVVMIARQFLREPEFVLRCAKRLGVSVRWPNQLLRAADSPDF